MRPLLQLLAGAGTLLLLAACAGPDPAGERLGHATPQEPPAAALPLGRDPQPETLLGLEASLLRAQLGPPSLERHERPAQVWQYRREDCVLDVFLYERSAGLEVVHLEARDGTAAVVAVDGCLEGLDATSNPES